MLRRLFWGVLGLVALVSSPLQAQDEGGGGLLRRHHGNARVARDTGQSLHLGHLKVSIWQPSDLGQHGPVPLIIFSHGLHGGSTQSTYLTAAWAKAGYLVVAPNHKDAGLSGQMAPQAPLVDTSSWSDATYRDRCQDVTELIATLHKDPHWSKLIDWSHVGLAGHSLGGYTVLGLVGAWPSWKLKEVKIKAVLALSPFVTPFMSHGHLGDLGVPVMYEGGTIDFGITPFLKKKNGAYDQTSSPAYFVEFTKASHFAFSDLNTRFPKDINDYSLAFLNRYLKGDKKADLSSKRGQVSELRSK
jgi:predicted dienelactone hydrolase